MLPQYVSDAAVSSAINVNKGVDDVLGRLSLMIADKLVEKAAIDAFITVIKASCVLVVIIHCALV